MINCLGCGMVVGERGENMHINISNTVIMRLTSDRSTVNQLSREQAVSGLALPRIALGMRQSSRRRETGEGMLATACFHPPSLALPHGGDILVTLQ